MPWDMTLEKYDPDISVTGTVTKITDFEVFVELEEVIGWLI